MFESQKPWAQAMSLRSKFLRARAPSGKWYVLMNHILEIFHFKYIHTLEKECDQEKQQLAKYPKQSNFALPR